MITTFTSFIVPNYKDLMLWWFGSNRDESDYRDGNYIYPVNPQEGTMDDPEYYFEECDFPVFGDLDSRGLRRIDDKLYWVYKISRNIYTDKEVFISSLCCYDFTDSVRHLLTCTSGPSRVLFNDFVPAILGYKNASPVTRDRSLLPLITTDGTYLVQYDFDMECHAFVLLKDGDRVTIVNYYSGHLYITEHTFHELLGVLWLVEQNNGDNRPLLSGLFGIPELWQKSEYRITSLAECHYWNRIANIQDYKSYLRDTIRPLFVGREEQTAIDEAL